MKSFEEREMAKFDKFVEGVRGLPFAYECKHGKASIVDSQRRMVAELGGLHYGESPTGVLLAGAPTGLELALEHCVLLRHRLDETRRQSAKVEAEHYLMTLRLQSMRSIFNSDLSKERKLSLAEVEMEKAVPEGRDIQMIVDKKSLCKKISNQRAELVKLQESAKARAALAHDQSEKIKRLKDENGLLHIRLNSFELDRLQDENKNLKALVKSFYDRVAPFISGEQTGAKEDKEETFETMMGTPVPPTTATFEERNGIPVQVQEFRPGLDQIVNFSVAAAMLGVDRDHLYRWFSGLSDYSEWAWKGSCVGGGLEWKFKLSDIKKRYEARCHQSVMSVGL